MKKRVALIICACIILIVAAGCMGKDEWQEHYDLGIRYLNDGNYTEAVIAFTAAIEIDSNNTKAYIGRANAYLKIGGDEKLSLALTDYEKVVELDENAIDAYCGMADVYIVRKDYQNAAKILKKAESKVKDSSVDLYEGRNVVIYSADESVSINIKDIGTYDGGWYTEPVVKMYSVDGSIKTVTESQAKALEKEGWYYEPVTLLYSPDGATQYFPESQIQECLQNGWYTEPVIRIYAVDGYSIVIPEKEYEEYHALGWYTGPFEAACASLYISASATDEELIEFAKKNYGDLRGMDFELHMGVYFDLNYDEYIRDTDAPGGMGQWILVSDSRASSMYDIRSMWYSCFSESSDFSGVEETYREFDGKLYASVHVFGMEGDHVERSFSGVERTGKGHVRISGTEKVYSMGDYNYQHDIWLDMVMEYGVWVCEDTM